MVQPYVSDGEDSDAGRAGGSQSTANNRSVDSHSVRRGDSDTDSQASSEASGGRANSYKRFQRRQTRVSIEQRERITYNRRQERQEQAKKDAAALSLSEENSTERQERLRKKYAQARSSWRDRLAVDEETDPISVVDEGNEAAAAIEAERAAAELERQRLLQEQEAAAKDNRMCRNGCQLCVVQ